MQAQATEKVIQVGSKLLLPTEKVVADWSLNSRRPPKVQKTTKGDKEHITTDGGADDLNNEAGSIEQLALSMKAIGQLQPAIVTGPDAKGRYHLVSGYRRYEACKRNEASIWVTVVEPSEKNGLDTRLANLAENIARKNLSPFEVGRACARLLEAGFKGGKVGQHTGLSVSSVNNYGRFFKDIHSTILKAWETDTAGVNVKWLLGIAAMDHPAQLVAFEALKNPKTENGETGANGAEGPKTKTRKGDDIAQALAILQAPETLEFAPSQEYLDGAVRALQWVLKSAGVDSVLPPK